MNEQENWNRIFQSLGRLEAGQDNLGDHIKAVSGKADRVREELQRHAEDGNAHGMGGERRGTEKTMGTIHWVLVVAGALSGLFGVVKMMGH